MARQSIGLVAVLTLLSTSIAVADPTPIISASSAPNVAIASVAAESANPDATDARSDDAAEGGPLSDVPAGHWAYDAVRQLIRDGVIVGYPDSRFKGHRPMTRYEAAMLTYRAVEQIEAQIAAGNSVNQIDIDAVKKLMAEFANELKDVEAHVAALQTTVDNHSRQLNDIKAEADATQLRVNQGKLGFNMEIRPGTSFYTLNGTNAAGASLPAGTAVVFGPGINNSAVIRSLSTGTNINLFRLFLGGQIDPRWSYGVRISDMIKYSPFGATSTSPSYCAGATAYTAAANCAYTMLNFGTTPPQNTLPLNLDYAYVQYSSPGGITSQIGRYAVGSYGRFAATDGMLLFGGQSMTGANLGYSDPHGHLYAAFYFGQQSVNQASLLANGVNTNAGAGNLTCTQGIYGLNVTSPGNGVAGQGQFTAINPYCQASQSELGGWLLSYFSHPRIAIGGAMDSQQGKQYTFYNPSEVTCTVAAGPTKGVYQAASPALCNANFPTAVTSSPSNYYLNGQSLAQAVEGFATAYFGPRNVPTFQFTMAYDQHIGVNPFTGKAWSVGADAEVASFTYASKGNLFAGGGYTDPFIVGGGRRNSNVVTLTYNRFGLNSLAQIQTQFASPLGFENNLGFTGVNGLQAYGVQAAHWFSDSIRFGLNAFHLQNDYNTNIPISTGGYITQLQENQLNAEMYLYFF